MTTKIKLLNGSLLPISAITIGATLTVTHYKWDDDGTTKRSTSLLGKRCAPRCSIGYYENIWHSAR